METYSNRYGSLLGDRVEGLLTTNDFALGLVIAFEVLEGGVIVEGIVVGVRLGGGGPQAAASTAIVVGS